MGSMRAGPAYRLAPWRSGDGRQGATGKQTSQTIKTGPPVLALHRTQNGVAPWPDRQDRQARAGHLYLRHRRRQDGAAYAQAGAQA